MYQVGSCSLASRLSHAVIAPEWRPGRWRKRFGTPEWQPEARMLIWQVCTWCWVVGLSAYSQVDHNCLLPNLIANECLTFMCILIDWVLTCSYTPNVSRKLKLVCGQNPEIILTFKPIVYRILIFSMYENRLFNFSYYVFNKWPEWEGKVKRSVTYFRNSASEDQNLFKCQIFAFSVVFCLPNPVG